MTFTTRIGTTSVLFAICLMTLSCGVCAQDQTGGKLQWNEITSSALENLINSPTTRPFAVYTPPSYETDSEARFPAVYVLHGFGQNVKSLTKIRTTADAMVLQGRMREMIMVFADGTNKFGGSQYRSSVVIGDYETYIAKDLVDHIDANYRTIADRKSRGITGYSMGGHGSLHLGLMFPEVFSVVVAQAGQYNWDSNWYKKKAEMVAFADPKDWDDFHSLPWQPKNIFSFSASLSPNPHKPPFFLDRPYRLMNGKPEVVPQVWKKHIEGDVIRRDLPRYLAQPARLNGILIVHGIDDDVDNVRGFVKSLTDMGIDHTYHEHDGGHDFLRVPMLRFMSDNLTD